MKKTLPLLLMTLLALPFCTKENNGVCWKCTTVVKATPTSSSFPNGTTITTVCNKTGREILDVEKEMSSTTKSGGITLTQTTTCKQQ